MKGYHADIEEDTKENSNFRKVLYTGIYCQLVVMDLKPGEEIGMEVHSDVDQFFRFAEGAGGNGDPEFRLLKQVSDKRSGYQPGAQNQDLLHGNSFQNPARTSSDRCGL